MGEHRSSPWPGLIAFVTVAVCVTALLLALILT